MAFIRNLNIRSIFRGIFPAVTTIVLLLTFLTCRVSAQLPEIPVTLDVSNKPVQDILDDISRQAGYYFTYNADLFPAKNRQSFRVKDLPVGMALDSLLKDTTLHYTLIDKNIVIYRKNKVKIPPAGQDSAMPLRVKGLVTDAVSGKPLPFATIAIYGTNKGTISNESGEFTLNIPDNTTDPVLVVSFIGYRNQYRPVTLPAASGLNISLLKDVVSLQEVIIRYQDPAALLDEALKRIPQNYLNDYSLMNAYYRENVQRNHKFLLFSEAVLDILKGPYNIPAADDKVKIVKGRKFVNTGEEDTIAMKIKSGIRSALELDIIKSMPYFLTPDSRNLFDFEFSDIVSYKNRLVYVIGFRQKPQVREALFTGHLYLDMENLAILAADFQVDPRYIGLETNTFVIRKSPHLKIRPLTATYHAEYRRSGERYHLSQVRGEVRFKMRKRKKWIASLYTLNIEMAITDVQPGTKQRFRSNETLNTGVILSDQDFSSDPAFWGDYNTIEPEASLAEVLRKMGKPVAW